MKQLFLGLVLLILLFTGIHASARRYDPSLEWREMSTPHVRVVFPLHLIDTARMAVALIEDILPELETLTGSVLDYRPAIVLHDQTESSQGYADPLQGEIHISVSQPSDLTFGSRSGNWLRLVLAHELAHLLHLGAVEGGFTTLRSLLGYVVLPNMVQPFWVWEGYAMYAQGTAGARAGADHPVYRMYLRDHALRDDFVPPHLLRGYSFLERFPGRSGVYVYGASVIDYIAERFGEESLAEISSLRAALLSFSGFERAVQRVLGISMETLWEEWREYMLDVALREKERVKKDGLTSFTVIGGKGFSSRGLVLRPDSTELVYILHHPHYPAGIWSLDPASGQEQFLVGGSIAGRPVFAKDGSQLIYSKRVSGVYSDWNDIFAFHLVERKETRLTRELRAWSPVFKGERILFLRRNVENEGVYALDDPEPLFLFDASFSPVELAVCPKGDTLAVSGWRKGKLQIVFVDTASGKMKLLPSGEWAALSPSFTEDGAYLLFVSDRFDIFNVYAYSLAEERIYQLTNVTGGAFEAVERAEDLFAVVYVPEGYALGRFHLPRNLWRPVDFGKNTEDTPFLNFHKDTEATVSPYRPLTFMAPRYWVPVPYGFSVVGQDPLAFHSYGLTLELPPGGELQGDIWYRGRFALPELEARVRLRGEHYGGSVSVVVPWKQEGSGEGYLGVGLERIYREDEMKSDYWRGVRVRGGISSSRVNEHWLSGSGWDASLRYGLWGEDSARSGVASGWAYARRTGDVGVTWGVSGAVGAADVEGWFSAGGRKGSWAVAGYLPGEHVGRYAARGRLEARFPVAQINSPLGSMGIIRGIDGAVFMEGALIGDDIQELHSLLTVGAQLSLNAYIAEEIPLSVTLGVAQPLERDREPEWYVEAGVGFTF